MFVRLAAEKLISYSPRAGARLTALGRREALSIVRRHRILEAFLVRVLGLDLAAVHEDAETAREMYERYVVGYCRSTMGHYEFDNAALADVPGYEYYAGLSRNIAKHGRERFAQFLAELQVWGTPDRVVEQMIENTRRIGGAGVIAVFSYGGMPTAMAKANIRLFADKVLPRLKAFEHAATRAA